MLEQRAREQTIIGRVQQPTNHKQPAEETELTIKTSSQVPLSNKLEGKLKAKQLATPQELQVGRTTGLPSKVDHQTQLEL